MFINMFVSIKWSRYT